MKLAQFWYFGHVSKSLVAKSTTAMNPNPDLSIEVLSDKADFAVCSVSAFPSEWWWRWHREQPLPRALTAASISNGSCSVSYLASFWAEILEERNGLVMVGWLMLIYDLGSSKYVSLLPTSLAPWNLAAVGRVLPCQGVKFLLNLKTESPPSPFFSTGVCVSELPGVLFLNIAITCAQTKITILYFLIISLLWPKLS